MYLTRMRLNESNPNTAKALASPHIFHGTVERCFGGERKRNLWRIDHLNHQLYLMPLHNLVCWAPTAHGKQNCILLCWKE